MNKKTLRIIFSVFVVTLVFTLGILGGFLIFSRHENRLKQIQLLEFLIENQGKETETAIKNTQPKDEEIIENNVADNLLNEEIQEDEEEAKNEDTQTVKILFLGDMMPGRAIGKVVVNDGVNPLKDVEDKFAEYDLVVGNLETAVAREGIGSALPGKAYTFNSPVGTLPMLRDSGIHFVSLANNHAKDYGSKALLDTFTNLNAYGIDYFGAGKNLDDALTPRYKVIKGNKIAFLGFDDIETTYTKAKEDEPGVATINKEKIKRAFEKIEKDTDLVIVIPHWGTEHALTHNSRQEEFAKYFIDQGADIVIGGHSHTVQDVGEYKDKKIYYSLGNFLFSGFAHRPNSQKSVMLEVQIADGEIKETGFIKIKLDYSGFPHIEDW